MLDSLFIIVLELSFISAILIICVLVIRNLFYTSPKWTRYILWGIVAFRLICPFFIHSDFGFLSEISFKKIFGLEESICNNTNDTEYCINNENSGNAEIVDVQVQNISNDFFYILKFIWISGIGIMLIIFMIESLQIWKKTKYAVSIVKMKDIYNADFIEYTEPVYFVDGIKSPFTKGVIRPRIYIPSNSNINDIKFFIMHEKIHISRKDSLWKHIAYFILSIHWFNPLVWVAFICFGHDVEYACDEKLVLKLGEDMKKKYVEVILRCVENEHKVSISSVTFGSLSIKNRIKSIIKIKKVSNGLIMIMIIVGVVVGVLFIFKPAGAYKTSSDIINQDSNIIYFSGGLKQYRRKTTDEHKLIPAIGRNGIKGYVREDELAPIPKTIEEALELNKKAATEQIVPLYNLDGDVIGEFVIGNVYETGFK